MAFCEKCGADIGWEGNCPRCGRAGASGFWSTLGILAAASTLAASFFFVFVWHRPQALKQKPVRAAPAELYVPIPRAVEVGEAMLVVPPRQYEWFTFRVLAEMQSPDLVGHFIAEGGAGNDIEVMVLNEDGFINFENGHPPAGYFFSGKVTAGTLNVGPLAPGTYYLVFDNSYSLVTNKVVRTSIDLKWMQ